MTSDAKQCTGCGSTNLASGSTKGGFSQRLWVRTSRFFASSAHLHASLCLDCGFVMHRIDSDGLEKLRNKVEAFSAKSS